MTEYAYRGEYYLKQLLDQTEVVREWLKEHDAPDEIMILFEKTRRQQVMMF